MMKMIAGSVSITTEEEKKRDREREKGENLTITFVIPYRPERERTMCPPFIHSFITNRLHLLFII